MSLEAALKKVLKGEVKSDKMTKHIYSVDASIFEMEPTLVVLPKDEEDLLHAVQVAKEYGCPITPRGGASGIAGGCLGKGLIIDTTKYLNHILEVNLEEKWVTCEPGVILDQLNSVLSPHGFRLGPDTSAANRATIGGMCATNATGAHFLHFGNMVDHVMEVEMILSSGEKKWFNTSSQMEEIKNIQREILLKKIKIPIHRCSSGYLLSPFLETPLNYAKLTVGSEGTLGLFSKLKLSISSKIENSVLVLFFFSSLEESLQKVTEILSYRPLSLELMDHHIISMGRLSPALKGNLDWLKGDPQAILIAEFDKEPPLLFKNENLFRTPKEKEKIWALRKMGLGLLLSRRSYSRAIAFIEDLAVPPNDLVSFHEKLKKIVKREMGFYGHVGDACLHIRPFINLKNEEDRKTLFQIMKEVAPLVKEFKGVLSGEHGDGLLRTWLNPDFFEKPVYDVFKNIKKAFDPLNLMNPGKIVEGDFPEKWMRKPPSQDLPTFLNFEKEGGFSLAVDLCNGNGECRKKKTLMCPSFHAFGDERHTTRARAESLRAFLDKKTPLDEEVLDVLDYCLECKGCKSECPSEVDMAKMKMEMLFQYQEKHGYFLLNRLFGHVPTLAKIGSLFAPISNQILNNKLNKKWLSFMGISPKRTLPSFATQTFSKWFQEKKVTNKQSISLFNDTFTEYFCPEIGKAAVELLETLGFSVKLLPRICCGRPFLSKGLLKQAKKEALKLAALFENEKNPILVLEPSCFSAMKEDYSGLIGKSLNVMMLDSFLPPIKELSNSLFIHPHCHEQVLQPQTLRSLFPKKKSHFSSAGCCGLAGSFGYQKKHYEMSLAIGKDRLFPEIQKRRDHAILASGFSCREQIAHGTGRQAKHLAEIYLDILKGRF